MFKKSIFLLMSLLAVTFFSGMKKEVKLLQEFSESSRKYSITDVKEALKNGALKKYLPKDQKSDNLKIKEVKNSNIPYQVFNFSSYIFIGSLLIYKNKLIILDMNVAGMDAKNFLITNIDGKKTLFYSFGFGSGLELYRFKKYILGNNHVTDVTQLELNTRLKNWATYEQRHMRNFAIRRKNKKIYTRKEIDKAINDGALGEKITKKVKRINLNVTEITNISIPYQIFTFCTSNGASVLVYKGKLILLCEKFGGGRADNFIIKKMAGKETLFYTFTSGSGVTYLHLGKYILGEEKPTFPKLSELPKELNNWIKPFLNNPRILLKHIY